MIVVSDVILEYGEAFNHDYLDVDGGVVRCDMVEIAWACDKYGEFGLTDGEALELRYKLGLCPYGGGHWLRWCEELGCDCHERGVK